MPNDDLQKLREKARLAMEGEDRRAKHEEELKSLEEKRHAAKLAMEGAERRQRREAREKETREREEMVRRVDEEVKKRKNLTEELARQKAEAEENRRREREAELKRKENYFEASKNTIADLKKEKSTTLHTLRTLQTDLAGAVKDEHLTETKMAIAEQNKPKVVGSIAESPSSFNWIKLFIWLFVVTIIAAALGFGYLYWKGSDVFVPPPIVVQSIIFAEKSYEINTAKITGAELPEKVSVILNTEPAAGEVTSNLYFVKEIPGETVTKKLLNFGEFLQYSALPISADFSRFVNNYMVGVYRSDMEKSIFLALKIDPFENVFQYFLENENGAVKEVLPKIDGQNLSGTTTDQKFADYKMKNLDTRVLRNSDGQAVLIYSFIDRQTLILARNEDVLYNAYVIYNTARTQ